MKTLTTFLCLVLIYQFGEGIFHDRQILVSKFAGTVHKTLTELLNIQASIRSQTVANLYSLPQAAKQELIHLAIDAFQKDHYPIKSAHDFLEFSRTGNRAHYEGMLTAHRRRLATLVIGQLLLHEANLQNIEYVDEILNGVWILLEESTWCWPAHMGYQNTSDKLPLPDRNVIDLGAGEAAKMLAWVKLLMLDKFDHVSKVVNKRIDFELNRRIFHEFLSRDNYWWEGFQDVKAWTNHHVNNWNIWVNGNILIAAMLSLNNSALFNSVLNKTLYSADYWLDGYGDDGGCDECPSYWRHSGGRLIEYIDALDHVFTGGKAYFSKSALIKAIGDYSYKMHIQNRWFVNFADADPLILYPPSLLAKYGLLFNDDSMKQYSAYMLHYQNKNLTSFYGGLLGDLNEFCNYLSVHKQIDTYKAVSPAPDLVWHPDVQVVNGRSSVEAGKFFIAAKAGNNHENHNHNDVGSFILFQNGHPVLIDIDVGTYTDKSFGAQRYELFYMQSQYHNCPTINGIQQQAGTAFNSHNVTFHEIPNNGGFIFTADIAGAYPKESHAKHWIRSFVFNRTANFVQIDEHFELDSFVAPQKLHFITLSNTELEKNEHGLTLKQESNAVNVQMEFDWKVFTESVEVKSLENDHRLTKVWGDSVKRITLTTSAQHVNRYYAELITLSAKPLLPYVLFIDKTWCTEEHHRRKNG